LGHKLPLLDFPGTNDTLMTIPLVENVTVAA
jgi:hypothetical protein